MNREARALPLLSEICSIHGVNLAVIAESPADAPEVAASINQGIDDCFLSHAGRVNNRIQMFSRGSIRMTDPVVESHYLTVRPFQFEGQSEILIAGLHAISLLEADQIDVDEEVANAADLVREAEKIRGHRRTIVAGDFNLNPFDLGLAKAKGFYAVMSRIDASRISRRLKHNDYPLFYNPMWSRFGDTSAGPPGTYFRDKTGHLTYYWHMYDQVLLRPDLLPAFSPERLHVLDKIGNLSLTRDGILDVESGSDHLPVFIELDLSGV